MNDQEALSYYPLGAVRRITPIHIGYIHETYKVEADAGMYVLQKVSPIFKPEVMEDISAALNHLKKHGLKTMEIISTSTGKLYVKDNDSFWRLYTYISGKIFEEVESPSIAFEAGKPLGTYHRVLNTDFYYEFKHFRSIKHNIPMFFEKYKKAVKHNTNPQIAKWIPIIDLMITLDLPKHLRKTVTHGDPKITNFIFTETPPYQALAMVDWDDVSDNFTPLYELGSAFRSWCGIQKNNTTSFSVEYFENALHGYLFASEKFLTPQELVLIPQAIKAHCLQLASRFVRDYFEGGYFQYDPKRFSSHQGYCLSQAQECIDLYNDITNNKEDTIIKIIKSSIK